MEMEHGVGKIGGVLGRARRILVEPTTLFDTEVTREPGCGYRRYYVPLVLVTLGLTTLLSWYGIGVHGLCGVCARVPLWEQALPLFVVVPLGICLAAVVSSLALTLTGIKAVHHISWKQTVLAGILGIAIGFLLACSAMLLYYLVSTWASLVFLAIAAVFIRIIVVIR